jgi:NAD-dependent dihydropyrimidine dehydrogenase PreA subunit
MIRKIIEIDDELCDGCGLCVPDCAEGSLQIIDGKARLVADNLCDGLGACLGSCPTGALKIIEREADEFDEDAVEAFLAEKKEQEETKKPDSMPCGCPSSQLQTLKPISPCQQANIPTATTALKDSNLSHWPIQIRLIPPHAPFLKNADLLVVADCCAVASPEFHQKYLPGKVVMMGCPKFDDQELYVQRFTEIIDTCNLKSITALIMDVPCCASMMVILDEALKKAKEKVDVKKVVIERQ